MLSFIKKLLGLFQASATKAPVTVKVEVKAEPAKPAKKKPTVKKASTRKPKAKKTV